MRSLWLALLLVAVFTSAGIAGDFAIVIHGGAGGDPSKWSDEFKQKRIDGLNAALEVGVEMLKNEQHAMDVVEAVVRTMEDNEVFNAGRGCVLNEQGEHELDASIMDGKDKSCGAVAGVRSTRNPISLARKVKEHTRHILLSGNGADTFAQLQDLEQASDDYFRTERQIKNWQRWKERNSVSLKSQDSVRDVKELDEAYFGTVGCVVLDQHGDLAAGTSTGGLMGKRWGRVGDSPIIGAGNYADNAACAVSGTGVGEEFIRHNVAADVAARMRYGANDLDQAARATIGQLPDDCGGIIAVDHLGNVAMIFNTKAMSRAFATSDGRRGVALVEPTWPE